MNTPRPIERLTVVEEVPAKVQPPLEVNVTDPPVWAVTLVGAPPGLEVSGGMEVIKQG